MAATILRHTANVLRCWIVREVEPNRWVGELRTRDGVVEASTEVGAANLVLDAISCAHAYRGAPVHYAKGKKRGR